MNIDNRIYGYVGDGYIICVGCSDKEFEAYVEAGHYADTAEAERDHSALFSHHDTNPGGEICESCHEYIFEPHEGYCVDCDEVDCCEDLDLTEVLEQAADIDPIGDLDQHERYVLREVLNRLDEIAETSAGDCIACHGPTFHLGRLGHIDHYRCRQCGLDQYGEAARAS